MSTHYLFFLNSFTQDKRNTFRFPAALHKTNNISVTVSLSTDPSSFPLKESPHHRPLMEKLSICWYIIERMLDLEGLRGWYCLRFFLDPLPLTICWLVMGGRCLARWTALVLYYLVRIAYYIVLGASQSLQRLAYDLVVLSGLDDESIRKLYESEARERPWLNDFVEDEDPFTSIVLYGNPRDFGSDCSSITVLRWPAKEFNVEEGEAKGYVQRGNRELPLVPLSKYRLEEEEEEEEVRRAEEKGGGKDEEGDIGGGKEDEGNRGGGGGGEVTKTESEEEEEVEVEGLVGYLDEDQEAVVSSLPEGNSSVANLETTRNATIAQEADQFYREYMRRMQFLDMIMEERMCALSGILDIGHRDLLDDMEFRINSLSEILGREYSLGIRSDFEMVYVGHSCLNWEALHHYYREVEALASSAQRGAFHYDVIKDFQHFEVQLERFTEDERIAKQVGFGGKQFWNYIKSRRRQCPNPFLQVPQISGYLEDDHDCNEESVTAGDVLAIIEKAIGAFSEFIEADKCKPPGKLKKLVPNDSPLENPNDLRLLDSLNKEVQKKEVGVKEIKKRKKQWWNKRSSRIPLDEAQRIDAMFSMVDIKLVSRVLKMSLISTQQLIWCREKLDGIQLNEGRVRRTPTVRLFPYS